MFPIQRNDIQLGVSSIHQVAKDFMSEFPSPLGKPTTQNLCEIDSPIPHPQQTIAIKVDPTVSFSMPHIQSNCVVPNNPNEANFFFTLLFLPSIYPLKLKIH